MKLGVFSVSLSVKNLEQSKSFYEQLGFTVIAGSFAESYLMMQNETTIIGLFLNMFEGNILTFSPGWDSRGNELNSFDDIRKIEQSLQNNGINFITQTDKSKTNGASSFMVTDPDGNAVFFDQHR